MAKPAQSSVLILVAAALSLPAAWLLRDVVYPGRGLAAEPTREAQLAQELEDLFSRVAEEVKQAVVAIETVPGDEPAPSGVEPPELPASESIGSGFVIDARGYILTNHHLVGNASRIGVRLFDNREFDGRLVQSDPSSDLALVRIAAGGLRALPLGNSDGLRVGQWVLAIGNPFGLTQTVSAGIISALKRSDLRLLSLESFIQTDASINPGNSGGPLVNLRGEAIGINTAMYTNPGGGNQGIGFAVPVTLAKALVNRWMEGRSASFLGLIPHRVDADMARYFGLAAPRGAFVSSVDPRGPAGTAGVAARDVILGFGGQEVRDDNHLRVLIAAAPSGEPVEVEVLRQGRREQVRVTPLEAEPRPTASSELSVPDLTSPRTRLLGITVTALSPKIAEKLGLAGSRTGIAVVEVQPGSAALKKGLKAGDVILEVNDKPVSRVEELRTALEAGGSVVMLRLDSSQGSSEFLFLPR